MKTRITRLLALLLILGQGGLTAADTDPLSYAIPANARKTGPVPQRGNGMVAYRYYAAVREGAAPQLIAEEIFTDAMMTERWLMLDNERHGIQRKWHKNGQLESESPYKKGVMQGRFRQWTADGRLIADYPMNAGSGREQVFFATGFLREDRELKAGTVDGLYCLGYPSGRLEYLGRFIHDDPVGIHCSFYENGAVRRVAFSGGPILDYNEDGGFGEARWILKKKHVSAAQYAAAADSSLPPYFSDPMRYKEFVPQETRDMFEKYKKARPVKIPLQFDAQGAPLLAN